MHLFKTSLTALAIAALTTTAYAAPAGKAVGVAPVARVVTGTKQGRMAVGHEIYMGDRIKTSSGGEVQIQFADRTRLVIGPGSELVIDQYVTSGSSSAKALTVNALNGAFRFLSGDSAKPAYKIKTPTGTIGIRGTRFDFGVRARSRTYVMLFDGVVRLCGTAGNCRDLDEQCEIAGTNSRGVARLETESDFLPRRGDLRRSFPYVRSQGSLLPDFRVASAPRCRDSIGGRGGRDAGGNGPGSGGNGAAGSN